MCCLLVTPPGPVAKILTHQNERRFIRFFLEKHARKALLFVEIIFRVWPIIFRGTFLVKMQNGHALTHIFSL
jgi:hypothetical protein